MSKQGDGFCLLPLAPDRGVVSGASQLGRDASQPAFGMLLWGMFHSSTATTAAVGQRARVAVVPVAYVGITGCMREANAGLTPRAH